MRTSLLSLATIRAAAAIAVLAGTLAVLIGAPLAGCSTVEQASPQARAARADRSFDLDVPRVMRGTIASETVVAGYNPTIVRGYGLVVGLDGTGSRDIPPPLKAYMVQEMARRGIGQESSGFGHLKPEQMLDSPDTAVVIVEGVIPAGAVGRQVRGQARIPGTSFDVRVYADPRTGTTSLEGGRLYTADLRSVQPGELLPTTNGPESREIAEASGPVFVNPFADPGSRAGITRTSGRIMSGGEALDDLPIKLMLATPSHARAEIIQNAVNTRFPQEAGQAAPTAHGESGESIIITVPLSYRDTPDDFVELLRHTTIRQSGAEAVAQSVKRALMSDPSAAYDAAWRWQALGVRALPIVKTLYDYPEEMARMAALRAGAGLDDALVTPHLIEMTSSRSQDVREQAIALLSRMGVDPRIDQRLRELVNDDNIDVRLAAYEAQITRGDPFVTRYVVDGKFVLDVIDCDFPMIYVTQFGQPRVAVFGRDLRLSNPILVDAWAGRLLLKSSQEEDMVHVYYRARDGEPSISRQTDAELESFIQFLGHETTVEAPRPGLGLSYSETVGALYQIQRQEGLAIDFRFDQDRVQREILRRQREMTIEARPEFSESADAGDETPATLSELVPPAALDAAGG